MQSSQEWKRIRFSCPALSRRRISVLVAVARREVRGTLLLVQHLLGPFVASRCILRCAQPTNAMSAGEGDRLNGVKRDDSGPKPFWEKAQLFPVLNRGRFALSAFMEVATTGRVRRSKLSTVATRTRPSQSEERPGKRATQDLNKV